MKTTGPLQPTQDPKSDFRAARCTHVYTRTRAYSDVLFLEHLPFWTVLTEYWAYEARSTIWGTQIPRRTRFDRLEHGVVARKAILYKKKVFFPDVYVCTRVHIYCPNGAKTDSELFDLEKPIFEIRPSRYGGSNPDA